MTSIEIENIIKDELKNYHPTDNSHGLDLNNCLIVPIKQNYLSFDKQKAYQFWTVLEDSEDCNGYKIYYDEAINSFGLGVKSDKDELIALGNYGTFLNALKGM